MLCVAGADARPDREDYRHADEGGEELGAAAEVGS
jgi:hypothetical protein